MSDIQVPVLWIDENGNYVIDENDDFIIIGYAAANECDVNHITALDTTANISELDTTANIKKLDTTANIEELDTVANIKELDTTANIECD